MRGRSGRLLPSVIVGGLLASGLALGAGTATAQETCTLNGDTYKITNNDYEVGAGGKCKKVGGGLIGAVTDILGGGLELVGRIVEAPAKILTPPASSSTPTPTTTPESTEGSGTDNAESGGGSGGDGGGSGGAGPVLAQGSAPPPAFVAAPAAPAAGPAGISAPFAPAGLATGLMPRGLSSSLFGAGTYDPSLLLGNPLGGAAAGLYNARPDSAVTTTSQAQALAAEEEGSGYGTPLTIGVIILTCLIAFAVRHRVLSRMKSRELPRDDGSGGSAGDPAVGAVPDDAPTGRHARRAEDDGATTVLTR